MATQRGFLFSGLFPFQFVWNHAVRDNEMSSPFVPDKSNLFTIWSLIPQSVHRTATARLAVSTTFHHGNICQYQLIYGTCLDNNYVFPVPRRFALQRVHLAQLTQYRQINLTIDIQQVFMLNNLGLYSS